MSWQLSPAHLAWSSLPHLCSVQHVCEKYRWISECGEEEGLNERKGKLERKRREKRKRQEKTYKEMLKTLHRDK